SLYQSTTISLLRYFIALNRVSLLSFTDPATTDVYTLSLHDALPISCCRSGRARRGPAGGLRRGRCGTARASPPHRLRRALRPRSSGRRTGGAPSGADE